MPKTEEDPHAWVLARWREISIPTWRRILQESIKEGTKEREEFARWMLQEILEDPEYQGK